MRFEHAAVVDAPIDEVFWLTQDYGKRLTWDPSCAGRSWWGARPPPPSASGPGASPG